jgi:hypothetical protein
VAAGQSCAERLPDRYRADAAKQSNRPVRDGSLAHAVVSEQRADTRTYQAVILNLFVIGEAATKLLNEYRTSPQNTRR